MLKETQKLAQNLCLFKLNSEPTSECFSLKLTEYPVNVNQNQSDPKNFNLLRNVTSRIWTNNQAVLHGYNKILTFFLKNS